MKSKSICKNFIAGNFFFNFTLLNLHSKQTKNYYEFNYYTA